MTNISGWACYFVCGAGCFVPCALCLKSPIVGDEVAGSASGALLSTIVFQEAHS